MKLFMFLFLCFGSIFIMGNTLRWSETAFPGTILGGEGESVLGTRLYGGDVVGLSMDIYDLISPPGIGTLAFTTGTISWHQRYYLVNQGDLIGESLVNTGSPVYDNGFWSPTPYEMHIAPTQKFMLGYWVDQSFDGSNVGPTVDDYFCWAELQWTGTDLVLLNSAGVSGAGGIYAGTWDVIPEPTTVVLFLLGGLALFIKKKIPFIKN